MLSVWPCSYAMVLERSHAHTLHPARADRGTLPAMPNKWTPPTVRTLTTVSGGWSPKPWTVESIDVLDAGTFVRLRKDNEWLYKLAIGPKGSKDMMGRVKIIDALRAKVHDAIERRRASGGSAVADAASAVADTVPSVDAYVDPMDMLDGAANDDAAHATTTKGRRRGAKRLRPADKVVSVVMPEYETNMYPTLRDTTRNVTLLSGNNYQTVSISVDDLPWLITWVADEISTGGVPMSYDDPAVADIEMPGIPGISIDWNSAGHWTATCTAGTLEGQSIVAYVDMLTVDDWTIVDKIHGYDVLFADSTYAMRRRATRDHLYHTMLERYESSAKMLHES